MGARAQPPWAVDLLERVPGSRPHWTRGSVSDVHQGSRHRGTLDLLEMNTWPCPLGTSCRILHRVSCFPSRYVCDRGPSFRRVSGHVSQSRLQVVLELPGGLGALGTRMEGHFMTQGLAMSGHAWVGQGC